jgi:hypothetical protein
MTWADEFDAFYEGTRRHVLHLAYAFTGDLQAAAAATQDAYASAWQNWPKLRGGEPLEVVRPESLSVAALRHGAHLVRRKPTPEADGELIAALRGLSSNGRRLVLLQTIGNRDLAGAGRELGATALEAGELTETSVTELETSLSAPLADIERRLEAMRALSDTAPLPDAQVVRRTGGRRHRRATAVAVAASAAVVFGGGYLVTAPATPSEPRNGVVATPAPAPPEAPALAPPSGPTVVAEQLLDASGITSLNPRVGWRETATSDDLSDQGPLASCAQGRFVSERLRAGFTRTYTGDQLRREAAVQTVELTASPEAATRAYDAQLRWYSGCQEPRVQLVASYASPRADGATAILVLRRSSDPAMTMTVGVARAGEAITTLVHQTEGERPVRLGDFAVTMDRALAGLCGTTGGTCENSPTPRPTPPPSTGEGTGFLGVVDLPPVANLKKVWGGTAPLPWRPNPPATPCDAADFSRAPTSARSRTYVVPEAEQVPLTFGITETITRFGSANAARAFAARTARAISRCDRRNPAADVATPSRVRQGPVAATVWRMRFSVADDEEVAYLMGVVVNRERVAQVTFSPVGRFDIGAAAYERLLLRAGERLAELPRR